ncbi:sugar phosphate isomerase/epimerase [Candidatus Poribacteria bacterium]|nr:sugar phosphate isomerase/epimerase [Candidatus Poribacteria bacterium]
MEKRPINFEFGLQSDLFWDQLGDAEVQAAAKRGFSFFEIWGHIPWFDIYSPTMASEVRLLVETHGMRVRSFHAPCEADWDISSEDEKIRQESVRETILSIENCRRMRGELVVVHAGRNLRAEGESSDNEHTRRLKKSIISFQVIQQAARENGVLIAVENLTANEVACPQDRFLELLDSLDPTVVGVCFDSSHANITPGTFEMFQHFRHKIITTHLSDNHGVYDEHRPPFTASIDWSKVLRLLLANGFRGPWLMEVTNGGNDPLEVLAQMELSAKTMKDLLQRLANDD